MGKREPEMMRPDKIEPYFICSMRCKNKYGWICRLDLELCKKDIQNCPKLDIFILK